MSHRLSLCQHFTRIMNRPEKGGGGDPPIPEEAAASRSFSTTDAPGGRRADAEDTLAGAVHRWSVAPAGHRGKGAALCGCHATGITAVAQGDTPLSENTDADGNVSERPDGRSCMLQRGWLC